jgi:hypothetical protein
LSGDLFKGNGHVGVIFGRSLEAEDDAVVLLELLDVGLADNSPALIGEYLSGRSLWVPTSMNNDETGAFYLDSLSQLPRLSKEALLTRPRHTW